MNSWCFSIVMNSSMFLLWTLFIIYLQLAFCEVLVLPENEYDGSLCYLGNRTRGQCRKSCPDMDISEYKDNICNPGKTPTLYCCIDSEAARLYPTLHNACMDRVLSENLLRRFDRYHEKTRIHDILRKAFEERASFIREDCEANKMKVEADERGAYLKQCLRRLEVELPEITGLVYQRKVQDVSIVGVGFKSRKSAQVHWKCTGYFVHPVYVLTSAHCFVGNGQTPNIVRRGLRDLNDDIYNSLDGNGHPTYRIINVIVHEHFDEETNNADIALVKIFRDVASESKIQLKPGPACLWTKKILPGTSVAIVGYDDTIHTGFPSPYTPGTCNIDKSVPQGTMVCQGCGFEAKSQVVGFILYSAKFRQDVHYVYAVGSGAYPCRKKSDGALFTYVYPYLEWIENVISRVK